jgi:hypothetical protein
VLLILASPHALSEPSGAGARPVHPIRDQFSLGPDGSFRGEAEVGRAAEFAASVENDPKFHCSPLGSKRQQRVSRSRNLTAMLLHSNGICTNERLSWNADWLRSWPLTRSAKLDWRRLYDGYAAFYKVPMNDVIADRVWDWINDAAHNLKALFARTPEGHRSPSLPSHAAIIDR